MTCHRSHCNEDSQVPLPLDQWAIWCRWSTGSLFSWCCSFSLDHIGIVFLIEVRNCLHQCLPDLASTDSASLESSFRYWIISAGLKFNNELRSWKCFSALGYLLSRPNQHHLLDLSDFHWRFCCKTHNPHFDGTFDLSAAVLPGHPKLDEQWREWGRRLAVMKNMRKRFLLGC